MSITSVIWGNEVDLKCLKGESFTVEFEVKDKNGTLIDMTQWTNTMIFKLRHKDADDTAPLIISTSDFLSITGASSQVIRVNMNMNYDNKNFKVYKIKSVNNTSGQVLYPYFGILQILIQ